MKFKTVEEFKNYIYGLIGKNGDELTKSYIINGFEFKHLEGKIIEQKPGNIYKWVHTFYNDSIKQSIRIECITRHIKTKDVLKIKEITAIEVY